jgi:glycerol-3-phosphate dehydrogenase
MLRSVGKLASRNFDLLVVGGGIYGAWTAYDAALRGLSVALIERDDWAAGTSSASSKLIHGGLRYLEQREFALVRRTLDERRRLARLGPHRVRPLRFLLPVYAGDRVGPWRLRLGLWLYDRLAGPDQPVPRARRLGASEARERWPLDTCGLRGAFTFGDCQTDDARFALEIVDGAVARGAVAANRVEATSLIVEGGRVRGAAVEDRETGATAEVRAGAVVACTGPWTARWVGARVPAFTRALRLTKGVHIVLPPLEVDDAFVIPSNEDRRVVFLIPWYGRTLVGTTDTDYSGTPDALRVEQREVAYLLDRVNRVLDPVRFGPGDVIAAFAGLRTLPRSGSLRPSEISREWRLDEPLPGLLVPVGGKFTSARADAAVAVDRALALLGRDPVPCATAELPFPWAPPDDYPAWNRRMLAAGLSLGLDEETSEYCQLRYGARVEQIYDLVHDTPELAHRIVPDAPFCLAEVVQAVRNEMALSLEDVLRRRVPLLLVSRLNETRLQLVVELVGQTLHWTVDRARHELATVLRTPPVPAAVPGPA